MKLPEEFLRIMQKRLGDAFPAFLHSYETPACRALRVNTGKISAAEFAARAPFPLGERVEWEQNAFYVDGEKLGADVYHFAGLYYLQEPSAMCAAPLLEVKEGELVLDLCAAPGGKTTQLAADMGGSGVLIANEIDFKRAKILSQNVERMGIPNCAVTCASPRTLAEHFGAIFDKVLVDAPCSGEGMFKKEESAVLGWSRENVLGCAARQKGILDCAANLVKAGGRMVYSTCTFSEEEDEGQVEDFLRRHPEFALLSMKKLLPHEVRGEGHFAAVFEKQAGETRRIKPCKISSNSDANRAFSTFSDKFFGEILPTDRVHLGQDRKMSLVPAGMPQPSGMFLFRLGVELGEWDGRVFKPAHALAMALWDRAARKVVLSREEAKTYLRGETVENNLSDGWCAVCVEEFPLGIGKCVSGTVKNHLPKALRLYHG